MIYNWDIPTFMLWGHKNKFCGSLFIVWVLCQVLFAVVACVTCSCTTKGHSGPWYVSRNDAHIVILIGTMQGIPHFVMILKASTGDTQQPLVSLGMLWQQNQLCNALSVLFLTQMSVCVMKV